MFIRNSQIPVIQKNDAKIHYNQRCGYVGSQVAGRPINYKTVKFLYGIRDRAEVLKGVKINDQTARIGDKVCIDGKRLFIERR